MRMRMRMRTAGMRERPISHHLDQVCIQTLCDCSRRPQAVATWQWTLEGVELKCLHKARGLIDLRKGSGLCIDIAMKSSPLHVSIGTVADQEHTQGVGRITNSHPFEHCQRESYIEECDWPIIARSYVSYYLQGALASFCGPQLFRTKVGSGPRG